MSRQDSRFERVARELMAQTELHAKGIANAMNERPIGEQEPTVAQRQDMWHHTPYGDSRDPTIHAYALQMYQSIHDSMLQGLNPQPTDTPDITTAKHSKAETTALSQVWPLRGDLIGLGSAGIDEQIRRANQLQKEADAKTADKPSQPPMPWEGM